MQLPKSAFQNQQDENNQVIPWTTQSLFESMKAENSDITLRTLERALESSTLLPATRELAELEDELGRPARKQIVNQADATARRKRQQSLIVQLHQSDEAGMVLFANDARGGRRWLYLDQPEDAAKFKEALVQLVAVKPAILWPYGSVTRHFRDLVRAKGSHDLQGHKIRLGCYAFQEAPGSGNLLAGKAPVVKSADRLSHLDRLEADSIHIMREVVAQAENPVMLYSVGKDSSVMLHLARKAFYPSPPPFPLMHVDTRWKFQAMYDFRDAMARESGMELIIHVNPDGIEKNINPFDHGSALHTDVMKTEGLKQALDKYEFDVAFGGARRDEEKSRAKERVFSFRTAAHRWDPKNQRPELWNLYNGYKAKGESIRVFPLSNWTELDIWQYIYREEIPIVPLYYALERPVVERDGMLMMVDDDRMQLFDDEEILLKRVRFRTLGCYPLTGAVESDADDLSSIVLELLQSRTSERQGRAIDSDSAGSMEKKKQEGYF